MQTLQLIRDLTEESSCHLADLYLCTEDLSRNTRDLVWTRGDNSSIMLCLISDIWALLARLNVIKNGSSWL